MKKLLKCKRRSRTCGNLVPVDDTAVHAIPIMTLELPPHNDTNSDDGSDQVDSDDSSQVDRDDSNQGDSGDCNQVDSDDRNQVDSDQTDIDGNSDVTRTMTSNLFCGSNTMFRDSLTEHLLE